MSSQRSASFLMPTDGELETFVSESNRIEGEPDSPGHPLYDDHLRVARLIAQDPRLWLDPAQIHRWLMGSQPHKFPGELRQVNVSVGGDVKMPPRRVREELPKLLEEVGLAVDPDAGEGPEPSRREQWCWDAHHRFEHIHPFWDGNGRTGRLWMNALRLSLGLPWLTVRYDDRFSYYRSIEEWEHRNRG